ncbi:MAG TPA: rhodanese-like domain-containing protein [Chloroflexota bacterium]|nr:rhodanese-like domain-containing protein [Chloroflexota bacterium]
MRFSLVHEFTAAAPESARAHFEAKLAFETDPADVYLDQQKGHAAVVLLDARSPEAFAAEHIPGALNLASRHITAETTAAFDPQRLIVTYCWGPGCNGSTRAAARLAALGFQVKELIGGLEYWKREGYPVDRGSLT